MTVIWKTKNINIQDYYKIIRRYVWLMTSGAFWHVFKEKWDIYVVPTTDSDKYRDFYKHIKLETSDGIAWGITMPPTTSSRGRIFCFVEDRRNPFIIRSNAVKIIHELAHAMAFDIKGTARIARQYDTPEGRRGTEGPAYVVLVHDVYYGSKEMFRYWIWYMLMWLPISGIMIYNKLKR